MVQNGNLHTDTMGHYRSKKRKPSNPRRVWVFLIFLGLVWLFCTGAARAGEIRDRISNYPNWQGKPPIESATGDLAYPDWIEGEWTVTTTLVDLAAPLAPEITTPGFDGNQQYVNQPVSFRVRFKSNDTRQPAFRFLPLPQLAFSASHRADTKREVVADRAFNGLSLATAYLGKDAVVDVKVDPDSPNRQVTLLRGNRQLTSTVTGRVTEAPDDQHFLTTEVFQQVFRGAPQLYFNEVETTTAYTYHPQSDTPITADQITAIYLSPQDADYFKALNNPVALYRYTLEFRPI